VNKTSEQPVGIEIAAGIAELRDRLNGTAKDYYTIEEVARLTDRAEYTVRKWISDGQLTAHPLRVQRPKNCHRSTNFGDWLYVPIRGALPH